MGFSNKFVEFLWKLGARGKGELEGEMEVSVMELYYSAKYCFCEYKKGNVCGNVAIII